MPSQPHGCGARTNVKIRPIAIVTPHASATIRASCLPAGSRIRGRISIAEVEDVPPDGLRVNYNLVIEIEGSERPACVAELIALHYR